MLMKIFQSFMVIFAIICLIAIVGLIFIYLFQPHNKSSKQEISVEKPYLQEQTKECKTYWERLIGDPVAFATICLVFVTALLAIGVFIQICLMTRAEYIAKDTAEAAKISAKVAENTLIATQRPWIKIIDVKLNSPSPIILTAHEININIGYQLKNIGTTPAADVKFGFEPFLIDSDLDMDRIFSNMKSNCEEMKKRSLSQRQAVAIGGVGGYLFPNEPSRELSSILMSIPFVRFEREIGRKIVTIKSIFIIAYATYKFPFDNTIHITGTSYRLLRKDLTPIIPAQKDDPLTGDGKAHCIIADKLMLDEIWHAYAD